MYNQKCNSKHQNANCKKKKVNCLPKPKEFLQKQVHCVFQTFIQFYFQRITMSFKKHYYVKYGLLVSLLHLVCGYTQENSKKFIHI